VSETSRNPRVVVGLRALLSAGMIYAGVMHFVTPEFFLAIMPEYLPWHLELVWISGVFEILLGAALHVPKLRSLAGWGLIALFLAVWPANIWMAMHGLPDVEMSPSFLIMAWVRVALQPLLMWWAYAVSRPSRIVRVA
jgi:uncharacterized membrane protein